MIRNARKIGAGNACMLKIDAIKDSQETLEEEILGERAAVLGRAGESVSDALEKLGKIERIIDEQAVYFNHPVNTTTPVN